MSCVCPPGHVSFRLEACRKGGRGGSGKGKGLEMEPGTESEDGASEVGDILGDGPGSGGACWAQRRPGFARQRPC